MSLTDKQRNRIARRFLELNARSLLGEGRGQSDITQRAMYNIAKQLNAHFDGTAYVTWFAPTLRACLSLTRRARCSS